MGIQIVQNPNKGAYLTISFFVICFIFSCKQETTTETTKIPFNNYLKEHFDSNITLAIDYIDRIKLLDTNATNNFITSRKYFKKIEPVLSVLNSDNYNSLNQPNILKVEEEDYTDIKIKKPSGYQVLEELLFDKNPDSIEISKHVNLIKNRLKLVQQNTRFEHLKTYHFLWIFRKAMIRVALTGITGFDAPVLENSLADARHVYNSLQEQLSYFKSEFTDTTIFQQWNNEITKTLQVLTGNFNDFDRYSFIKNHTHKQLVLWNQTVKDWNVTFPFELAVKNDATSLFSENTFNISHFADHHQAAIPKEKIVLGKKLFYDTNLSKKKQISCASCHQPQKAFTDGLKTSKNVSRNSPTLLYAALQQAYFYDKRAGSLEGQIVSVVENNNEFHTDLETLEKSVLQDSIYAKDFAIAYPNQKISNHEIRNAIASYIRTLIPFNSKFDKNISGLENTITQNEINGFNLFTGKAKCATCHFAPLFNGTVPPDYKESEIEHIGVPSTNDTINATISNDLGRYMVYKTPERKHFFKTSTVRNASKTSPYMHNGVYTTLSQVLDFYNRGGGSGIGILSENQTLPSEPLNLTNQEINDIIAFIRSLEDEISQY